MVVVAVVAGLCACARVPILAAVTASALILTPTSLALLYPYLFAKPGRRLLSATWVACLWPLSLPWSLMVVGVITYCSTGELPGHGEQGFVNEFLFELVMLLAILSVISTIFCVLLPFVPVDGPEAGGLSRVARFFPVLLIPPVWVSVWAIFRLAFAGFGD